MTIHVRPDLVVVVVTGPSGAGKTTVGRALAARLGWRFEDGDDHHSPENVAKMAAGTPLNDADREPWLAVLSAAIRKWTASGEKTVLACSALKRRYRQVLTAGRGEVAFAYLDVSRKELHRRIRTREGHFVPESLLTSQLADLEPPTPEEAWIIPASGTVDETVEAILAKIRSANSRNPRKSP